ncbi:hypothetical protein QUA00_15080 [Microcoleus sp. T2B6]
MPVPQQTNIFVQASCLLYLCFQNRQDACSTTGKTNIFVQASCLL